MLTLKDYVSTVRADRARVLSELLALRNQVAQLAEHVHLVRAGTSQVVQEAPFAVANDALLNSAVSRVSSLLTEFDAVISRYPSIVEGPEGA